MSCRKVLVLVLLSLLSAGIFPAVSYCLPQGEQVVAGEATFDRSESNTLNVNTPSDRLITNWDSFNIGQL
jgi:hypothetical protein